MAAIILITGIGLVTTGLAFTLQHVVGVSNPRIFDEPIYNYSKDYPYLADQIAVVVPFDAD